MPSDTRAALVQSRTALLTVIDKHLQIDNSLTFDGLHRRRARTIPTRRGAARDTNVFVRWGVRRSFWPLDRVWRTLI